MSHSKDATGSNDYERILLIFVDRLKQLLYIYILKVVDKYNI